MDMDIDGRQKLHFDKTLLGPTRAIKVADLTPLLMQLHVDLKHLEQEAVDKSSLEKVAKELIHEQLLKNKNKTVKALIACCLADILRLYAPEAPYDNAELRTIFKLFVSQLMFFGEETPDFEYYFYLLESLATVKSIIIVADLDNPEEIVSPIFYEFFNVASKSNTARNVQLCMTDILIQLIADVGALSQESMELILEQFGKYTKTSNNSAFTMASDICNSCTNILQRRVCQYFSDVLLSVSGSETSDENLEELRKVHHLIQKINDAVPDLLLNVLPLLQEEMVLDEINVRQIATEVVGQMFIEPNSTLSEKYPTIWKAWLGRRNDKSIPLRVKWLDMSIDIIKNHPQLEPEFIECYRDKLSDPDEKVRAATCRIVGDLVKDHDIKTIDKKLVELVAERSKDKKASVRNEAMEVIGAMYAHFYDKIKSNDRITIDKVGWIPNQLFACLYVGDASVTMGLEKTLLKHILPFNDNDSERADRLVTVVESLQPPQRLAFTALVRKQKRFNDDFHKYADMVDNAIDNLNTVSSDIEKRDDFLKYVSAHLSDKARTLNALRSFLNRENERDIKLLQTAIDLQSDYKRVINAKNKLVANLNEDQAGLVEIFEALLNRACPIVINKTIIPHLMKIARAPRNRRQSVSPRSVVAQEILKEISASYPVMYDTFMDDLLHSLLNDNNDATSEENLELLAEISKSSPSELQFSDYDIIDRLSTYVTEGNLHQIEYASIILGNMKEPLLNLLPIVEVLQRELIHTPSTTLASLTALSHISLYEPRAITPSVKPIIKYIENNILSKQTKEFLDSNPEWCAYDELPLLSKEKIVGVKLLVNYLTGCKDLHEPDSSLVEHIFEILWQLMDVTCESAIGDDLNAAETSHLRLTSSQALVLLTEHSRYTSALTIPQFEKFVFTLQDTCYYVRSEFAESLMKGLQTKQIHSRYYALLFICAHEPEVSLLKQVKLFIQKRHKTDRIAIDTSIVRLIHILAHHPDFSITQEDLIIFAQYIRFFLSCVATSENASFLYHVIQKIKLSKDVVSEELSENSYVLSDMACLLLKIKCRETSCPLNAYEGQISLQSKLYRTRVSDGTGAGAITQNYLPTPFIEKLEEEYSHKIGEKRTRFGALFSNKKQKV
ncbi:armadillo-type protein [Pilobolus umbonatus]|nr:armadillo-type protein [Pilobolus umbonatus]